VVLVLRPLPFRFRCRSFSGIAFPFPSLAAILGFPRAAVAVNAALLQRNVNIYSTSFFLTIYVQMFDDGRRCWRGSRAAELEWKLNKIGNPK